MFDSAYILIRWGHNVVNIAAIILSMCTCLPLGYIHKYFDASCVLFSEVFVVVSRNETVSLDHMHTTWGEADMCSFTTFMPVIAGIHCFIWTWFFIHMKQTIKDEPQQEGVVVLIMVIMYGVTCLCMLISSTIVTDGVGSWCKSMASNQKTFNNKKYGCSDLQDLYWITFMGIRPFYTYVKLAKISSWLLTILLGLQTGLAVFRGYTFIKNSGFPSNDKDCPLYGASSNQSMDKETGSICFNGSPDSIPTESLDDKDSSFNPRDSFNFSSNRNLI